MGCDGYVHYLDCGKALMEIHTGNAIKLYAFNMFKLLYVNDASLKRGGGEAREKILDHRTTYALYQRAAKISDK